MITNKMITNYQSLIENNNHGELLETIAADLKLNKMKQVFHSINTIHNIEGHIEYDLLQVRDRYRNYLKDHIMIKLPPEDASTLIQFV